MAYSVKVGEFEGPLDLLLQLVENEELSITEVALSKVTEQFLAVVEASSLPTEELADFLLVAAKLLLLKSQALLPELAGEVEEAGSLANQLKIYQQYYRASKVVEARLKEQQFCYAPRSPLQLLTVQFRPPQGLTVEQLGNLFARLIAGLKPLVQLPQIMINRTISLSEKISRIWLLVKDKARLGFQHLVSSSTDKTELIVTFLAILELTKQKQIAVEQTGLFSEITIIKR
ncbi:MAG: ScpA family protein [Candidatus Komeilibacteria bacterium]|nr:ScpA family protein [Candidatus Komeilibacteria bacterium]